MAQFVYKNISPEFASVREFSLVKTWEITGNELGSTVQIYDALKDTGSAANSSFNNLDPATKVEDYQGYNLSYNYELGNGQYYFPTLDPMVYSGSIKTFNGNEFYFDQDNLPVYPPKGTVSVYGYPKKNIWYSLWHLFYRRQDDTNTHAGSIQTPAIYGDEFVSSSLNGSAYVFSIPRDYMGDSVEKKSFRFTHANSGVSLFGTSSYQCNIVDDGLANLYDLHYNSGAKIGNISYNKGLVIITNQDYRNYFSSSLEEHRAGIQEGNTIFSFNSSYKAIENEYTCIAKSNEFNMTSNVTAYDSAGFIKSFLINTKSTNESDNFHTFVTTIGLYDENDELLVVAKFPKPYRLEKDLDAIFIVRFDTN